MVERPRTVVKKYRRTAQNFHLDNLTIAGIITYINII